MATWDELRPILAELERRDPSPLTAYPGPATEDGGEPPFAIRLAAWAVPVAAHLHGRFGDDVELIVGALRHPSRTLAHEPAATPAFPPVRDATVAWAVPPRVRSGHTARLDLTITNAGTEPIEAHEPLIAEVVDPRGGEVVGAYTGPISLALIVVAVPPGSSARVPVLVGTDSLRPALGYAVPAGRWGVRTVLRQGGRPVRTPLLPLDVVE